MKIRLATPADLDAIQAIVEAELFLDKPGFCWHMPQAIDQAIRAGAYFVGVENDDVVGITCLSAHGNSLWIDTVALRADHQRKGLGRRFIDFARLQATEQGLAWLRVTTYREYGMDAAYEALGFLLADWQPEYSEFEMHLLGLEE